MAGHLERVAKEPNGARPGDVPQLPARQWEEGIGGHLWCVEGGGGLVEHATAPSGHMLLLLLRQGGVFLLSGQAVQSFLVPAAWRGTG